MYANVRRTTLGLSLSLLIMLGTATGIKIVTAQEVESPMSTEETRTTALAYFSALIGGGAYETYFDDDIVLTISGVPGEVTGPEATRAAVDAMHHEQFDAEPEILTLIIGEGTVAAELMFTGTHTGEFAGIAATGMDVEVPYTVFYTLAEAKITSVRIYSLVEGLVRQLQAGAGASDPQNGTMHVTKECSEYTGEAGSTCTITASNFDLIPVGSVIVYAEAVTADGNLDTDLVINTPSGDVANGHVILHGATQTGMVTLAGGTGQLANLSADLVVAPLDAPNYSWDGPYSY